MTPIRGTDPYRFPTGVYVIRCSFWVLLFVFVLFGFCLNGFKRHVSQPVSRAVDPRARRSV